jgi:hypothetical protein
MQLADHAENYPYARNPPSDYKISGITRLPGKKRYASLPAKRRENRYKLIRIKGFYLAGNS